MLLKRLIARPRPHQRDSEIAPVIPPPDGFSFPSGHAMNAFAAATAVAGTFPLLGAGLLAISLLIGASRVFLGLHYPTDVAVGALLGIALGQLVPPVGTACFFPPKTPFLFPPDPTLL
jgi:undecaprenyl-diphosphatase